MPSFIFRCPTIGISVQGWISEDAGSSSKDEFISINCTACRQIHLVNAASGKVLGGESKQGLAE